MNNTTSTQILPDFNKLYAANLEEQKKVEEIGRKARERHQKRLEENRRVQNATNATVSMIQKTAAAQLSEIHKADEEEYKADLVAAGLTLEAYPMATAMAWADHNVAKKVFGFFGKAARVGANITNYVKSNVKAGYEGK